MIHTPAGGRKDGKTGRNDRKPKILSLLYFEVNI